MKELNWSPAERAILDAVLDTFRSASVADRPIIIADTAKKIEALRKDNGSTKKADVNAVSSHVVAASNCSKFPNSHSAGKKMAL